MERRSMRALLATFVAALVCKAVAQSTPSFKDKTITIVVGSAAGGTIDNFSRLFSPYLARRLEGQPTFVVRNSPGAEGVTATKAFVTLAPTDGSQIMAGASPPSDLLNIRRAGVDYDLTTLEIIGGVGRASNVLVISKAALPRLQDKSKSPVIMGALTGVRSGNLAALWGAEFLGWNTRWVLGYPTSKALLLAMERGEIDMTSITDPRDVREIMDDGRFAPLAQPGMRRNGALVAKADFDAPLIADLVRDKIDTEVGKRAFAYWDALTQIGVYFAFAHGAPAPIVGAFRTAWAQAIDDAEYREKVAAIGDDVLAQSPDDVMGLLRATGAAGGDVVNFMQAMGKKQGLDLGG